MNMWNSSAYGWQDRIASLMLQETINELWIVYRSFSFIKVSYLPMKVHRGNINVHHKAKSQG